MRTLEERFWAKVEKTDGCWVWCGATRNKGGYGAMRIGGKQRLAHRVSWELSNGPIPGGVGYSGTCVLHKCDVPACVNPEHLFLGTQSDNVADRDAKGRSNGGNSPGEAHSQAKLTGAKVLDIRSRRGESPYALAKEFGVSYAQIWNIRSGKSWRHI